MKNIGLYLNDAAFFKVAFAFSSVLLIVIAIISFRQLYDVNVLQEDVIMSRNKQIELHNLISEVKDAERTQRGFIITGKKHFIKEFEESKMKALESLHILKALSKQGNFNQKHVDTLNKYMTKRLSLLDKAIHSDYPHSKDFTAYFNDGAAEMIKLDFLVSKIILFENRALNQYEKLHKTKNQSIPYTTGILLAFTFLIFLISFYKISKDSVTLRQMNEDLMLINQSFQYAEEISNMGHWIRNLANFNIYASDNMYRLLGMQPKTSPLKEDELLSFVHPDDRQKLEETFQKTKSLHLPPNIVYRIYRTDGQLRHIRSTGKLITINKVPMIIGATCDITNQIEINASVEQKNRELQKAVGELASFNHIASHDLQEPLRKIQMFISRIAVEEADVLSATGLEYFERVSISALRMEQLINDLLLYAETNKEEQVFEMVDLKTVVNEAVQELAAEIEEKNATVLYEELPVVLALPFQMRQLFINLIGNSLKYSSKTNAPVIKIISSPVKADNLSVNGNNAAKSFYKISIIDNGIGFKQEFSKKIFELFQRLHKKEHYSGTGIGLAICKKIIDNHKGFITATGNPDEGATFNIFIPKVGT